MTSLTAVSKIQDLSWSEDQIKLLKDTVCHGSTDDEFKIFCHAVQRTGLDPFMKQIHAVKRWNAKKGREDMAIQVGIDGYRLIADRTGLYAGNDDPVFDNEEAPTKATSTVYKIVGGMRCAFTATARWSEYYPGDKQGFMWKKMPCVMLGKVAESIALRKAFPAELSGIYTDEEMQQADRKEEKPVHAEIQKPTIPLDIVLEVKRIRALQQELNISEADFKAELHKEFQADSMKGLSLQQLKKMYTILEEHKKILSAVVKPESDEPWLQEALGPITESEFK